MRTLSWLRMVVVLGAVGCGSSPGNDPGGSGGAGGAGGASSGGRSASGGAPSKAPTAISETEICPTFIADACRAVFECPELAEVVSYPDQASCRNDLPCRGLADFEAELTAGYITWDAKKAATCHDFLIADLCGAAKALLQRSLQGVLALCPDSPALAAQATAEPCIQDIDCTGQSYCAVDETCGGTCAPQGKPGDLCGRDSECLDPLDCSGGKCTQEVVVGVGEPCFPEECDDTSTCDLDIKVGDFVCKPLSGQGQTCSGDFDCLGDLNCLEVGDVGTCEPLQERAGPCNWDSDCAAGLACVQDKCGDEPKLGEECNSFLFGGDNCAAPYICSEDVCKKPRAWGESCGAADEICAEGLCENGKCVQRRPNGAICEKSNECRFRACIDDVCADPISCRPE